MIRVSCNSPYSGPRLLSGLTQQTEIPVSAVKWHWLGGPVVKALGATSGKSRIQRVAGYRKRDAKFQTQFIKTNH
jgi:hypothetical protein